MRGAGKRHCATAEQPGRGGGDEREWSPVSRVETLVNTCQVGASQLSGRRTATLIDFNSIKLSRAILVYRVRNGDVDQPVQPFDQSEKVGW